MGGNSTITTKGGVDISAERIPLEVIGRKEFVQKFQKFLLNMNIQFKKEYGYYIWEDKKEIMNGGIFNGSTSFIMSPDYTDSEVLKYKKTAGDLDVAVPRELGKEIFDFLDKHEGEEFTPGIKYVGNNAKLRDKLGNTIICIAKAQFGDTIVQAQLDLELSEMVSGKQTEWSKFAHSSSFDDAKAGMKGVFSKYFWRALVGSIKELDSGFVVVSPAATEDTLDKKRVAKQPSKIRLLNFGVDSGVGAGYELMKGKLDGKDVYRKKGPKEKTYTANLEYLMQVTFGIKKFKPTDTHSFVKVLEIASKNLDKKTKQTTLDRFLAILYGMDGQAQFIEPDMKEDLALKLGGYMKAVEALGMKPSKDLDKFTQAYIKKVHKQGINESFRSHLNKMSENRRSIDSLENSKDLRNEINRLKKLMLRQSDELQIQTMKQIKWLESKIQSIF